MQVLRSHRARVETQEAEYWAEDGLAGAETKKSRWCFPAAECNREMCEFRHLAKIGEETPQITCLPRRRYGP